MSNAWKGYANVNDDVRHTYERVFYGRQTTGDLTASDVPGMEPGAATNEPGAAEPAAGGIHGPAGEPENSHQERESMAKAWEHAEHAHDIRREIEHIEGRPYTHTDAPDIQPRGSIHDAAGGIHGPAAETAPDGGNVWGKGSVEPGPAIEPPSASPTGPEPSAGNDMTPG